MITAKTKVTKRVVFSRPFLVTAFVKYFFCNRINYLHHILKFLK